MLALVKSCAVVGLDGVVIDVEVDTRKGLPAVVIVGLPDAAVQESRERVQSAVKNAGFTLPRGRIIVNLAPAAIRKAGPIYDLPISLGVLIANGDLHPNALDESLVVGELSLDGHLRHVRGVLLMADIARREGFKRMYLPEVDAQEAALIPDLEIIPVSTLTQLVDHLLGHKEIGPLLTSEFTFQVGYAETDFKEIKGQEHVKRALEVAAAGGHNLLLTGPPGGGKTLMARALPGILPRMTLQEAMDATRIYSIADQFPGDEPLLQARPFRAPHHTISHAGLVGGGNWPQPGEISLAHYGVLFLDELPEFGSRVLETMRQPMEDKVITISRAQGSLTFPANFQLVAAMNPCPCGYFGDTERDCTCSNQMITRYQKRISGPLLDRIDMHVETPRVDYDKLSDDRLGESSEVIQARVEQARERQRTRFEEFDHIACNADMGVGEVREFCGLDDVGSSLLENAMKQMQLTARAYHRVLKLSRTIADLAGDEQIEPGHIAEALQYRPKHQH